MSDPAVEDGESIETREVATLTFFFWPVVGSVEESFGLVCSTIDIPELRRRCRAGNEGDVEVIFVGGVLFPSNVRLVGVNAVDTSETESFLIKNCGGEAEGDESDFGIL